MVYSNYINGGKMKKIVLSFCFLILFGILAILPIYSFNVVAEGEPTEPEAVKIIDSIDDFDIFYPEYKYENDPEKKAKAEKEYKQIMAGHYKIVGDVDFIEVKEDVKIQHNLKPLGTKEYPFTGTLDGGGNNIKNVKVEISDGENASFGLVAYASGATIKNLSIDIDFVLTNEENSFKNLNIGGIAGYADSATKISNCKTETRVYSVKTENEVEVKTNAVSDASVNFGGFVGEGRGIELDNSFALVEVKFEQRGNSLTESYFGGAVGKMDNGKIHNVYVAPIEETISSLTGVVASKENLNLQTSLTGVVNFGGIVGYVSGTSFEMFNTLFIGYLKASDKVNYAGLIGRIHSNESFRPNPSEIQTSKYLTVPETNTVAFNKAIGNAEEVSFVVNSTLRQITSMPNDFNYFQDSSNGWHDLVGWDFANTWRESTIYSATGIFLPDLQQFSELSVSLDYGNFSKFYTLNFIVGGNPLDEVTSKKFKIGDTVEIQATFNTDKNGTNYADFYEFGKWQRVGDPSFSADGVITDGIMTYSFVCSKETAKSYNIEIIGKPVKVNVYITNAGGQAGNYGAVKHADTVHTGDFDFTFQYANPEIVVKLDAINVSEQYVFSNFADGEQYYSENKSISFKLEDKANGPKVFVNKNGELVCNIVAVFTNNTSVLSINTTDGGTINIDNGEELGEINATVVKNKEYILTATAVDGYNFDGWYLGKEKIGAENILYFKINEDTLIEAKFTKIIAEENGINIWIIIGPIIGGVVLAGIITLIVIKVKKNGSNSYKRNYRY